MIKSIMLKDGDGLEILPETKSFHLKCCDCGLTHEIEVEHKKNSKILYFKRQDKEQDDYDAEIHAAMYPGY